MIDSITLRMIAREIFTTERAPRVPEPELVMEEVEGVGDYADSSVAAQGEFAVSNLFNMSHICEVIKDGDTVVDLCCGPAGLLTTVARHNPRVSFIGVDLSHNMLEQAAKKVSAMSLDNVALRQCDVTKLSFLPDHSCDAVTCTLAMHHLPTLDILQRFFSEIARVLKPGGGVYLMDFCRLKATQSQHDLAFRRATTQSPANTENYLHSVAAAFSAAEFRIASQALASHCRLYAPPLVAPFIVFKGPPRRADLSELGQTFRGIRDGLVAHHRDDFNALLLSFRLGGLKIQVL